VQEYKSVQKWSSAKQGHVPVYTPGPEKGATCSRLLQNVVQWLVFPLFVRKFL